MLFVYVKYLYTHIPHPVAIEMGDLVWTANVWAKGKVYLSASDWPAPDRRSRFG